LSAQLFLAFFITYDDFTVGYLTKEILAIAAGTEELATESIDTRKKAGDGGARASRKRKMANLEVVMQEIEKLSSAAGLVSEERLVAQAFEEAELRQASIPKSRRIRDEYGTTLRSEEPFKSRYRAVFHEST
jgi:hypothetical protein